MFANILVQKAKLPTCQQIRFVRKTFKFRYGYGDPPLVSEEEFQEAKDGDQLTDLEYKRIRFATLWETNSPLQDKDYNRFTSIKRFQLSKLRNRKEKEVTQDAEIIETDPMQIFKRALKNCEPVVVTKKVKRGGAIYQVPFPLSSSQSEYLATKWIINSVLERPKPRVKHFPEVMAQELIDAAYNRGKVVKKKDDMHRLADANKAYAHYRWG